MRWVVSASLLGAALAAGCGQATRGETAEDAVARGKYLVENIGGCNDCHTPMTPQGPDRSRTLQGAELVFEPTIEIPWAPLAPPIAGLPEGYTPEQFAHFMQTGERPDGTAPLPPMPAFRLNQADAEAMTAYVESLPHAAP